MNESENSDVGSLYRSARETSRELARELLAAKKKLSEIERVHQRELDEMKARLQRAEEAAESALAEKNRALEEVARGSSESDEAFRGRAELEERAAVALSQVSWAKEHANTAQQDRAAAEAKVAEAEAAAAAARDEAEAALEEAVDSEMALAEARGNFDELHKMLIETEASRAQDADTMGAEIARMRRELRQVPGTFDATFERNSNGLLVSARVQVGNDPAFTLIPVRNGAGHIVEFRREPTEKIPPTVKTALGLPASRRA